MNFSKEDSDTLLKIIYHRRDTRGNRFLHDPVPSHVLDQLLFAFEHAPSVGYSQPWRLVVIEKKETKEKIKQHFVVENDIAAQQFVGEKATQYRQLKLEGITEAPINIAVFYEPLQRPVLGQSTMPEAGPYSVVCGIQNMWLMARALNIGMGWVSILQEESVKEILKVPSHWKLVAYLCVGYVTDFLEKPELELIGWDTRKNRNQFISFQ
jgi:5,6-dimethylbenzimidazole synthase